MELSSENTKVDPLFGNVIPRLAQNLENNTQKSCLIIAAVGLNSVADVPPTILGFWLYAQLTAFA